MKQLNTLILVLGLVYCGNVTAQGSLDGTWQGELSISADLDITVEFIISSDSNGRVSALINSPDNVSINNITASAASITGDSLSLEFDSLNGAFAGELSNGVISGEWSQPGDSFPLILNPYVVSELGAADIDRLVGGWFGSLGEEPNLTDIVFNFELNEEGNLTGALSIPAQGANLDLAEFGMADSQFSFTIPQARVRYEGQFTDSGLEGTWNQNGNETPLNLSKGEYIAPNVTVLNLTEADKELLLGSWSGQLGPLTLVFRFEKDDDDKFVSFVDSPTQGATDLPVTEVNFINNQLKLVLALGAVFNGEMDGEEINGQWTQGGMTNPLTVTRE